MRAMRDAALWYFLLIAAATIVVRADFFEECANAAAESFVASTNDCRTYIYCDGDDSMSADCDEGEYFDGEGLTCDAAENVFCPLDAQSEPEPGLDPEPQPVVTQATTTTTPPPTIDSGGATTTFDPLNIAPVVRDSCPPMEDPTQIVLIANGTSCADYYLCYHGHPIEMRCTNHLHFNAYTARCDFPENVQCQINRPGANQCLPHITDFFPHPDKCNYFYFCIKGFLTVQQCPFYYGWDIERRSCVHISQAKCASTARRT